MRRCHTFLFADLVGFTAYTETFGDDAAADVAIRFTEASAQLARDHGACLVKCLGDGVMLRGGDAGRTVELGLRMQSELAGVDGLPPIHAGAHTGCAVERGGDWYGSAVNLAARVADSARGGELLLTEATVAAAGQLEGVELEGLGPQLFRNVSQATAIYSARAAVQQPQRGRDLEALRPLRPLRASIAPALA
jgi:adenylate cyclase